MATVASGREWSNDADSNAAEQDSKFPPILKGSDSWE